MREEFGYISETEVRVLMNEAIKTEKFRDVRDSSKTWW